MQASLSLTKKKLFAFAAAVAVAAPASMYLAQTDTADASPSATTPLATINMYAFEYANYSVGLTTDYIMGTSPEAVNPRFTSDRTNPAVDHSNFLQLSLFGGSSVVYDEGFTLQGTQKGYISVPKAAGSVGLAIRSNGTTTHNWHIDVTLYADNGKTYTSGDQTFAINTTWNKRAVPLTSTVPAGVHIDRWTIHASVNEDASLKGTDGGLIMFDDYS